MSAPAGVLRVSAPWGGSALCGACAAARAYPGALPWRGIFEIQVFRKGAAFSDASPVPSPGGGIPLRITSLAPDASPFMEPLPSKKVPLPPLGFPPSGLPPNGVPPTGLPPPGLLPLDLP